MKWIIPLALFSIVMFLTSGLLAKDEGYKVVLEPGEYKAGIKIEKSLPGDLDGLREELKTMDLRLSGICRSDGSPDLEDIKKRLIVYNYGNAGDKGIKSLIALLKEKNTKLRRNACLVFSRLADRPEVAKNLDLKKAAPALAEATKDKDFETRAFAWQALEMIDHNLAEKHIVEGLGKEQERE